MPIWLIALFLTTLAFYTDDYVIAGILPELAEGLNVSEAAAGQLVTVFSLTIAVATPTAAVLLSGAPRKRLIVSALMMFSAANVAAMFTDHFAVMVVLRIIAALSAAVATPSIFVAAASLAPPEKRGRYLGFLAIGVTGSIAFGVPLGAWIGTVFSWHATFLFVAGLGVLAAVWVSVSLPTVAAPPTIAVIEQFRVLRSRSISFALAGTGLAIMGSMMLLTYLVPFVNELIGTETSTRTLLFSVTGIAGTVGVFAGGYATDKLGPNRTIALGMGVFVVVMCVLSAMWPFRPIPLLMFVPVVALWGVLAFWSSPAIQTRMFEVAGDVAAQAMAMNTSVSYLGIAVGGALGGLVLDNVGPGALPLVTAVTSIGALALLMIAFRSTSATPEREPAGDPRG
ncbi:MFS transporter [Rhodococcus sp. C3V]|uniref:MFS transporter n=1 Tax=Rhodococcus sp. C3V TaxID=3034165 RepID=UPI0023E22579|nr:MFS transporter [Rhodococcus sp. C3V]MDF3319822.1 MFS transporter [Rhodococcus sp. C3V]